MKFIVKILNVIIILTLLFSCKTENNQNLPLKGNAVARYFIKNTEVGLFREADFNDEPDVILLLEDKESLIYFDSSHAIFRYFLGADRYYVLNYVFESKRLNEIWFDLFLDNDKDAELVMSDFSEYFDKKYGAHFVEMGYNVWIMNDSVSRQQGLINLSNESQEYGYGKLNLTIYKSNK